MNSRSNWSLRLAVGAVLVAATLIAYWPLFTCDFTNFDDDVYVTGNSRIQSGFSADSLGWAFTTFHGANWHPLTWLSHILDWSLYGPAPWGHHLTSLLLHLANTLLLFVVLERLTGALGRSAFVAALFAVHPLHVESVAWIAERKDVLSALFWMLGMWAYVLLAKAPSPQRKLLLAGLFAAGLAAKPMLVSLPFVLLLLDYWPLGRFATGPQEGARDVVWRLVREKSLLFALAAASGAVTIVAQRAGGGLLSAQPYPLPARLANALVSYVVYLWKAVWPRDLAVFYPHPGEAPRVGPALAAAVALLSLTAAALRLRRSRPYVLVGWLWFVITLAPVIGLIQVGDQALADRYTYLPLVGLFVIVAWGGADLGCALVGLAGRATAAAGAASTPAWLVAPAALAIAALVPLTRVQVGYWRDSVTLFEHALAVTGGADIIESNLGDALVAAGRPQEAVGHFAEAVRRNPGYVEAHCGWGAALMKLNDAGGAAEQFREALHLDPRQVDARVNLGVILVGQGRVTEAIEQYERALAIDPGRAGTHNNLGIAFGKLGRAQEAIAHYEAALRIDPDFALAHHNLGVALAAAGRTPEAIGHYREAIRLKPDYTKARYSLAAAYLAIGDRAAAAREIDLARRSGVEPPRALLRQLDETRAPAHGAPAP